ncbi:MAG: hypothetical protein OEX07_00215 [Gammaproteobacteria bacterium]|nr:hypothetical protein [Gammaproteobacteria bacterium]
MIKSVLFLSLYTAAGIGSWSAYSFISDQDTSLNSLTKLAAQVQPALTGKDSPDSSNIVYRWKDYKGNWTYEDSPYSELSFENYEDELKFLQNLKQTQHSQIEGNKDNEVPPLASVSAFGQIKKLFDDARNVENLLNLRKENMDKIIKQE